MRTKTLILAAALTAAGLASSLAQSNVYSLNVVGYVNKTLGGNLKYTGVANPLNTTNNTLAGLFGGAGVGLPTGSQVLKWNTGIANYDIFSKLAFGSGWSGAGATTTLNPGEGCLIRMASGSADLTNTFVGEVLQGNLTNVLVVGYQLIGNIVPDSGPANTLNLVPVTGSQLLKWNAGIQNWDLFNKVGFGSGWSPSVPSIEIAEGFILRGGAGVTNWVRNFTVQ